MNPVLPIYFQIKQIIRGWILDKEFSPGEKIPSENELAERFKVSRLTVRQAISQLTQEGFLNSKRGEGTYVTLNENLINSLISEFSGFIDDLLFIPEYKIKSVEMNRVVATNLVKEKLELGNKEKEVMQIKRVRVLRNNIYSYIINNLPLEVGEKIREKVLYEKPLLKILEQDLGISLKEAVQTIRASFADQEVAEKIGILSGSPILFIERVCYTKRHKPIELFQSSYPGDAYKFIIRFKKFRDTWVHEKFKSQT